MTVFVTGAAEHSDLHLFELKTLTERPERVERVLRSYPGRTVVVSVAHPADCRNTPEGCSCGHPRTEVNTTEYYEHPGTYGTTLVTVHHHTPCLGLEDCRCLPMRTSEFRFAPDTKENMSTTYRVWPADGNREDAKSIEGRTSQPQAAVAEEYVQEFCNSSDWHESEWPIDFFVEEREDPSRRWRVSVNMNLSPVYLADDPKLEPTG